MLANFNPSSMTSSDRDISRTDVNAWELLMARFKETNESTSFYQCWVGALLVVWLGRLMRHARDGGSRKPRNRICLNTMWSQGVVALHGKVVSVNMCNPRQHTLCNHEVEANTHKRLRRSNGPI